MMERKTQNGYLLLADISGYTSFVAKTEIEHAGLALSLLLEVIVESLNDRLTISKLEGDAVFCYCDTDKLPEGKSLLELIDHTYLTFRDKAQDLWAHATCGCNACKAIPTLDLKFLVHHGDFIIQQVAGIKDLLGTDVNLIHRLLKNHVAEATGWRAYMMFTERCLDHLKLKLENTHVQIEEYEHLGEVKTYNMDLHQRYKEIMDERRIVIDENDSDIVFNIDFSTPPPMTWEWIQDPVKRNLWGDEHTDWSNGNRPKGRAGNGASAVVYLAFLTVTISCRSRSRQDLSTSPFCIGGLIFGASSSGLDGGVAVIFSTQARTVA
jgi:hypothetical protein